MAETITLGDRGVPPQYPDTAVADGDGDDYIQKGIAEAQQLNNLEADFVESPDEVQGLPYRELQWGRGMVIDVGGRTAIDGVVRSEAAMASRRRASMPQPLGVSVMRLLGAQRMGRRFFY